MTSSGPPCTNQGDKSSRVPMWVKRSQMAHTQVIIIKDVWVLITSSFFVQEGSGDFLRDPWTQKATNLFDPAFLGVNMTYFLPFVKILNMIHHSWSALLTIDRKWSSQQGLWTVSTRKSYHIQLKKPLTTNPTESHPIKNQQRVELTHILEGFMFHRSMIGGM